MFCPLCPGTGAQTPGWSKFGRGREGGRRSEGVREGCEGGTRCLRAVTHTPVPGPGTGRDKRLEERERERETVRNKDWRRETQRLPGEEATGKPVAGETRDREKGRAEQSGAIPSPTVATAVETVWGPERGARDQQSQDRESSPRDRRAGTRPWTETGRVVGR